MAGKSIGPMLRSFHHLFGEGSMVGLSDSQLLELYAHKGDALAFEALIGRHGSMVLAVCREVLKDPNDVQDAFQATFLVLIRRAGSLWSIKGSLGSWLYRVAYRIAIRASANAARRRAIEAKAGAPGDNSSAKEPSMHDLFLVLHEEIDRLPERLRAPIVLCHLQQMTHAQAATQLGWTTDTVRGRVARARGLLRSRLTRRGAVPAIGGLTALLSEQKLLAAVPRGWVAASVQAASRISTGEAIVGETVSATAAAFSEEMIRTMGFKSLLKMAASAMIGVAAIALGASAALVNGPKPTEEPAPVASKPAVASKPNDDDETGTLDVRGQVLDPNGEPISGAAIHVHHWVDKDNRGKNDANAADSARVMSTGPDGRFQFVLDKSLSDWPYGDGPAWHSAKIAASVPGYGPAWIDARTVAKEGSATLTLVRDDVPIRGRILNTQGRPIEGVAIHVVSINAPKPGIDLDAMLASGKSDYDSLQHWYNGPPWMKASPIARTGADGRFEIRGIGRDRIVSLELTSPTTQTILLDAMARVSKAQRKPRPLAPPQGQGMMRVIGRTQEPELFGAVIEVVAGPTKPIVGTVRAEGTGKPIPGIGITGIEPMTNTYVHAVTDVEGKYRLSGLPKAGSYELNIRPRPGERFLERWISVSDTEGLKPIETDVTLPPGVLIRGRLIDKATGESVRALHVDFIPLPTNPNGGKGKAQASRARIVRMEKIFQLAVPSGEAMLLAAVPGYDERFVTARLRKEDKGKGVGGFKDKETFTTVLDNCQAYKIIDVPSTVKEFTVDLYLTRGISRELKIVDPDGKPVLGAQCYGWKSGWGSVKTIEGNTFKVEGLEPDHSRRVIITHQGRSLTGSIELKGDSTESGSPTVVHLQPAGVVTGRLVDEDGLPMANVKLGILVYDLDGHNLPQRKGRNGLWPSSEEFTTDADGRFRAIGFIAGVEMSLGIESQPRPEVRYDTGKSLQQLTLGAGETRDLGDVKAKPRPASN